MQMPLLLLGPLLPLGQGKREGLTRCQKMEIQGKRRQQWWCGPGGLRRCK